MRKDEILETLRKVYDPEYPLSVTDLQIVKEDTINIDDENVRVQFIPTTPYCPMGSILGVIIKYALEKKFGRDVDVTVKPGTFMQEQMANDLLTDRGKYENTVEKLKTSGLLERCVQV